MKDPFNTKEEANTMPAPKYKVVNGTSYHMRTPNRVVDILERFRLMRNAPRLKVWYGDRKTKTAWEAPQSGTISRSMGPVKIPLMIHNRRSRGGPGLLEHCIVRISYANRADGGILYTIPDLRFPFAYEYETADEPGVSKQLTAHAKSAHEAAQLFADIEPNAVAVKLLYWDGP